MSSDDRRPPEDAGHLEGDDARNELESAQQYMQAHELIEHLRAERRPDREVGTEEDARLSATAALLHAAGPDAGNVDPDFAARLFARLETARTRPVGDATLAKASTPDAAIVAGARTAPAEVSAPASSGPRRRGAGVSRRGVLLGGLGAAAAALAGAAVTAALDHPTQGTTSGIPPSALVPEGAGSWVSVAALSAVPLGAVKRFEAGAVVGYVRHTASGIVALSGVCTHMACMLQWNSGARTFDCPCHGGRFLESGQPAPGAPYVYPPLPSIQTKIEADQIWVYAAGAVSGPKDPPADGTPTPSSYGYGSNQHSK